MTKEITITRQCCQKEDLKWSGTGNGDLVCTHCGDLWRYTAQDQLLRVEAFKYGGRTRAEWLEAAREFYDDRHDASPHLPASARYAAFSWLVEQLCDVIDKERKEKEGQ